MTTTNLPVSQEDRDAAALMRTWDARSIRRGAHDSSPIVQAFARHRTQADAAGYRRGVEEAAKENADLRQSVLAFGVPWAVNYARDFGFPDGHLHPAHYDILAKAGARMASFTRGDPDALNKDQTDES